MLHVLTSRVCVSGGQPTSAPALPLGKYVAAKYVTQKYCHMLFCSIGSSRTPSERLGYSMNRKLQCGISFLVLVLLASEIMYPLYKPNII